MSDSIRLLPLGGLGQIGMNCMVVDTAEGFFLIDCGIAFDDGRYGARLVHADFSWIVARHERFEAIVLTHGHEDHLGAVVRLLDDLPARSEPLPIYGPRYAVGMLRDRFREFGIDPGGLIEVDTGERWSLCGVEIEPFEVTHSIPDATGLIMRSPAGTIVHSGDFKIDPEPPGESCFDHEVLKGVREGGVRLLLSDSTGAMSEGRTKSESEVVRALGREIEKAPHRVVIGQFASNGYRLAGIVALARQTGRRLCVVGRSARNHLHLGIRLGLIDEEAIEGNLIDVSEAADIPRHEILIVASGTQGEGPSSLTRLATGEFRGLSLEEGDSVILSSRIIPGNEEAVFAVIDRLRRRGISVIHRATHADIHASGHARRDELRELIRLVEPRGFLPVHGTFEHMVHHAELARDEGVEQVVVIDNGQMLEVSPDALKVVDQLEVPLVHRSSGGAVLSASLLEARSDLGRRGHMTVVVDVAEGKVESVYVNLRAVTNSEVVREEEAEAALMRKLRGRKDRGQSRLSDGDALSEDVLRAAKRWASDALGFKPVIDVMVIADRDGGGA